MKIRKHCRAILFTLVTCRLFLAQPAEKPKLTLDEFFNSVAIKELKLSPDGNAVVIGTERADWEHNMFRRELWLYRDEGHSSGTLVQFTQGGRDTGPQWSPDGKWIAFLSERKNPREKDSGDSESKDRGINQLYVISLNGGEAIPLTRGEEEVHAFGWSRDSRTLYFATRNPWTKEQKDAYKKDWKDVIQYRAAERGDTIFTLDLADAIRRNENAAAQKPQDPEKASDATPGARPLASTPWRVQQVVLSPDGGKLAFVTSSISERQEKVEQFEILLVDLTNSSSTPIQLTTNHAVEQDLRWSPDGRHIFFNIEVGDVTGPYRDLQPHLYWVDIATRESQQWSKDFIGSVSHYALSSNRVLVSGRIGTEVPLYSASQPSDRFARLNVWPGTYDHVATAEHSPRIAFTYSALERPTEVYLADSIESLPSARPITSFNQLFTERELPKGKPYRWTADDGTRVEGMLLYPPGKFERKNLPMFTLIHGGPADADGNHFEADWYQWDRLAATQGWLVFEPNYRGSTGYGDKFLLEIVPQIVSRPGKDILEGIDALVKDGMADPQRLAVGGYSYGGYMTNWLITQTTRFKAAVTGAGAVEHVANWGNDDTTFDDAYFLGGRPWEAHERYHDEAAIFQIAKVKTPTHIVGGAEDIRVAVLENYLLDRALDALGIPSTLLVFPGEGHSLDKNPWHGKIKVREELKWLQKYGGVGGE
ncbi:MAG TPA: prolyl oligopeptidase family serine peptidase [Terriglobales bacterium]|nr:prolyl oligopeptidase family serine peptidase [Terriglobales bacterium]